MFRKRGQVYLIAAMILIAILIGFATVSNYSKKKVDTSVIDLGKELEIEGEKVLDYGAITGDDQIENFTSVFSAYAGDDVDIYYIFGKEGDLRLYNGTGLVSTLTSQGGKISVTIKETDYEFDLKSGENFYFVISKEIEGEQYVVTN